MKKYLYLLFVALFATMSFSLTSCGDDDDEPNGGNGNIVGTWKVETMKMSDDWWQVDYVRFNDNGTYKSVAVVSFMGDINTVKDSGTWSKDGDKLTMDGKTATIKELSNSKMVLNLEGANITYTQCADSEMDKYLK